MARSIAIFDWVFGLRGSSKYKLYYWQSPNEGLSDEAIAARAEKEAKSLETVERFAKELRSVQQVWAFLNHRHDLYTSSKLIERAKATADSSEASDLVKKSYGGKR